MSELAQRRRLQSLAIIIIGLVALIWTVFGQTLGHQFVNYDDPLYVLENSHVNSGLSWRNAGWAFTHVHSQNWHPLTSISHMLDVQLFGLKPGGHHFVNVHLHSLAAVSLFLALTRMTGAIWPSAFVAALFAIHPLRVESVAWVAERKDVLSGLFFALTLCFYAQYARERKVAWYLATAAALAGGLMSKPMLVTTPFILLLLDYWPLRRLRSGPSRTGSAIRLLFEKVPLFVLVAGSIVATLWAQNFALGSTQDLPLKWRVTNAVVSYWDYLRQMFWPHDLVPFYLHPEGRLAVWQIALAAAGLIGITLAVIIRRRKNPYLFTGWFWYVLMLGPVIGLVQVGLQGRADRYTYLPQIGLAIALTWLIRDLTANWPRRSFVLAPAGAVVIGVFSILAWRQTSRWHDSETLWRYALTVSENDVAHVGLAGILAVKGQLDEAAEHYRHAIAMRAGNAGAQDGLARVLAQQQKVDGAIEHWRKALEIQPDNLRASNSLALMYVHRGDYADAVRQWNQTLSFDRENPDALNNLAWLLATTTQPELKDAPRALELAQRGADLTQHSNPTVLRTLAVTLSENGRFEDAARAAGRGAQLAERAGTAGLAAELRRFEEFFRRGKSWREARAQQ